MGLSAEALAACLLELRGEYVLGLGPRLQELREALSRCGTDPEARVAIQRGGHRLAGTARTVGLDPIGTVGRALEGFCARTDWGAPALGTLSGALELLEELSARAASGGPLPEPHGDPRLQSLLVA
ncbi:MAG: Hpt domain-containing protein [Deltaproteobacteria bacterium]|nr:Hpt domain-containing protein [Deltaproteobacteria bacterium]